MIPTSLRVFVNGAALDLPFGSTALDAVRAASAELAVGVEAGTRLITDSRGRPAAPDSPAHGGAIYRVIVNRAAVAADAPESRDSSDASDDTATDDI